MNIEMMLFDLTKNADLIFNILVIGIGATIIMDVWAIVLRQCLGIKSLNYALVWRWIANMPKGIFRHDNITTAEPVTGEIILGWVTHYLIGIIFAVVLIIFTGADWLIEPSIFPAITFGILTVSFPFFLMQPCLGFGIAAAKTPNPMQSRLLSLLAHTVFGLGLYCSAIIIKLLLI